MTFSIIFSDFSLKQLKKLPKDVQIRIMATLRRCSVRPYPHVKRLVGSKYCKLRVGDYRVILDIVEDKLIVHVVRVGHRKSVYKNLS
jgi:mRNA interferase RelE/StbE